MLTVLGLIIFTGILVNLTPVQNFLARKAADYLSERLETKVSIDHLRVDFLNHLLIRGLYVADQKGDTLLYAGEARVRITDWFILRNEVPVVRYLGLKNTYGHLYRTPDSAVWNYQFVVDAFDTGPRDTTKKENAFELDLKKLELENVRFHMNDGWVGSDLNIDAGEVSIDIDEFDLKKRLVAVESIDISGSRVSISDYEGGRPPQPPRERIIDTTAFNPGLWSVRVTELNLTGNRFDLNSAPDREAYEGEFDPQHMDITGIDLRAKNIRITGDTLTGKIEQLAAQERSGVRIKKMSADVSVSPNASIADNLYLETNNSKLQHYYAMHYERFPDFTDYINKVVMVADISNSRIDSRDVAFFAPALKKYPAVINAAGHIEGTVTRLKSNDLFITDGETTISGDLAMTGLPDINSTFIDLRNGNIFLTNQTVFRYAPHLRQHATIAFEKLTYAHYKGDFAGFIEHFAANGQLTTNLGTVHSNVKLKIPGFNPQSAVYSGALTSSGFDIGLLFRQSKLGRISFRAGISGAAFDPKVARMNLNAEISRFDVNGYPYSGISAHGILAQRRFDGNLMVDDPNLALAFTGSIDFNGDILDIDARGNLLNSDLQELKLTNDSVVASGDFDLNFVGTTIDDFIGYAKLYNIDVTRNVHRLDLDSVYINSTTADGLKLLSVAANGVTAELSGNFQLSNLHHSLQFYLSGYMPNYIQAPTQYAPRQEITFSVMTDEIDSLLGVFLPEMKGFNNSTVKGSINTENQHLELNVFVPFGSYGNIHLKNAALRGSGNYQELALRTRIENIGLGEDLISAAMDLEAHIGNDSVSFSVQTKSPDNIGNSNINGEAYAHGDSLYLRLQPSEFFIHNYQWNIPSGNEVIFARNFLQIRNLQLTSGTQTIRIRTEDEKVSQRLLAEVDNLDVDMLGKLAGIADYRPDGEVDALFRIDHLYNGLTLTGNVHATEVTIGDELIGTIRLAGSFDARKQIITLDPQSGVFLGASSIRTAGSMSFDSTSMQQLNGYIAFNEARVAWIAPLVSDFLGEMSGRLNGTINIGGSAAQPDVQGDVVLNTAATRVTILGSYYKIPFARLQITNTGIDFGQIAIYDSRNNIAQLTGGIAHDRFRNMRFNRVSLTAPDFEVLNLKEHENSDFYGNLTANVKSLTVSGTMDDVSMTINATPSGRSHIYIPVKTTADINTYSYVSFKDYDEEEVNFIQKKRNKFSLTINAEMNPLAEMTLVMDPSTGDMINARGYGTIQLHMPADDEMKMYGNYQIEEGDYTFTLRQLAFRRNFIINSGSNIAFNGALANTNLDINAIYTRRARLIDLLNEREKESIRGTNEERDAKAAQDVHVLLHMAGSLNEPKLSFGIDLAEKREGALAYQKLKQINLNDRDLFDQVAALLLVGTFIPQEGWGGTTANTVGSGAINNISDIFSSTASTQLTNIVNKLLGDPDLSIELKYKNYNLSDPSSAASGINRNEVSFGVRKNLFDDRLVVELGSAYDWGRPTSTNTNTSNLNLAGDFRVQYLLTEDGRVRLNAFRTNNWDVLVDRNIWRGGLGISYRRSFDNLGEFLGRHKAPQAPRVPSDTGRRTTPQVPSPPQDTVQVAGQGHPSQNESE